VHVGSLSQVHRTIHHFPLDGVGLGSPIGGAWAGHDLGDDWCCLSRLTAELGQVPCLAHAMDLMHLFSFLRDLWICMCSCTCWVPPSHLVSMARMTFYPHLLACSKASTSSKLFRRYPLSLARTGAAPFAATCPLKASTTVYILDALPPKDPLPPGA